MMCKFYNKKVVPRARNVIEGNQLKYVLGIKEKSKGRRGADVFIKS